MKSFTFNGISSESLGIIIQSMPSVPRAEKNIESIEVLGRNGNLHIDNGCYKSKEYTIECACIDKTKIDDIKKTLIGTHNLVLSINSDRYYVATIKNQIDFSIYLNYYDSFPLQFELEPIAKGEEITTNFTANGNLTVGGNVEIYPTVTIEGTGTATINGYPVKVLESGIEINCELMQCYKNGIAKNDKVNLDNFPKLNVGSNSISLGTGITKVTIKHRNGWL